MINYQGEEFTETEFYGREILEAIQLTNKFPTPKKVLIDMLEEMIHEQLDLIDYVLFSYGADVKIMDRFSIVFKFL